MNTTKIKPLLRPSEGGGPDVQVAYVQRTSLIDCPGMISAVLFTVGCSFRCPYCHNPELVIGRTGLDPVPAEDVLSFLEKRRGRLDSVVITGGEPTLQADLAWFMARIRDMGFFLKLDTNGSRPEALASVIEQGLADYIAMDVKAPPEKYAAVAGTLVDITRVFRSIEMIMSSGVAYEFRTTFVPSLLDADDVAGIARTIEGASLYVLQRFVPSKHIDPRFGGEPVPSEDEMKRLAAACEPLVGRCIVR
jgi:pyruvate formate lyase activating enzyme